MSKYMIKRIWKELPRLPSTALIFYLSVIILWKIGIIPSPSQIVILLEKLYLSYGLIGLSIATFLEGVVYLGLYFPGSFIIALSVFLSDGSFLSLLIISVVVAIVLTITSFINYFLGRHISFKNNNFITETKSRGLMLSLLHPNLLAFYFFNEGIKKRKLSKVFLVPILMIPYGLIFAGVLYKFADITKQKLESPLFLTGLIIFWFIVAFVIDHKTKIKKEIKELKYINF